MLVRRSFRPWRMLRYVWRELVLVLVVAVASWWSTTVPALRHVALPFPPLGVLGTALAVFLAFRNNTGYARWWEARTLWGTLHASARTVARLVVTGVDNAQALGKGGSAEAGDAYRREMLLRLAAFAHALRLTLRAQEGEEDWAPVRALLAPDEWGRLQAVRNRPNRLLHTQGERLRHGVRAELLGPFDPISLEPHMAALHAVQAGCERIKQTPLLRQYDVFTRLFLRAFLVLLPPSLLGLVPADGPRWLVIPLALVIGFVYAITQRVGEVSENPFEHLPQDVPMTTLCVQLERDLRELLGETTLPPLPLAADGAVY